MATAIRDDNPVVYLHHYLLTLDHGEVPDGEYLVPFGEASVRREGSEETAGIEVLRRRLLGVVTARHYVMLDYDVPADLVDRACAVTPGLESPTVSPLQNRDWCAVRAMVPRIGTNAVMDELYDLGARAILVTDITACRL